ncbi:putative calcium-binding protein CML18 [Apostasia shenzhenica]|uniref:Putative calcium-binding protein CML18 n=1 Tax=Apostasia shenzhenica TaxID=1088818 RepID=A0A2I0BBH8_9ASPA|nr:putative calcium-binding protein CML18 [Apostasia shenzhenica]
MRAVMVLQRLHLLYTRHSSNYSGRLAFQSSIRVVSLPSHSHTSHRCESSFSATRELKSFWHRNLARNQVMEAAPAGIEKMEEVEKVFNRYDANGDGKISASELQTVVRAIGSDVSDEESQAMIQEMDSNCDGLVDLKEFADFHRAGGRTGAATARGEADLRDAFRMYDLDGDGLISVKELHQVLNRLGERCSAPDCSRMIFSVDSDGDGCVNFEEFKKMMGAGTAGRRENFGK